MRRCDGATASAYCPPSVAALSARECAEARATLQSAETRLREVWRSYLGLQAGLAKCDLADTDSADGALTWQCGAWAGRVWCGAELQRAIVAAATGFDAPVGECAGPLGPVETAVVQTVLAAVLRTLLEAFGLPTREPVRWRGPWAHEGDDGLIVRASASAAGLTGQIAWQLPLAAIRRPPAPQTSEQQARLRDTVSAVPVTVQATVTGPRLTTDDIARLAPGDIVLLGGQSMEQVSVVASERPIAHGQPGFRNDKLAIRITEMPLTNEVHDGD